MNISPLSITSNYPAMGSPAAGSFSGGQGLNKFDATIVQMRNAATGTGEHTMRSPPPPIVSIPLPRE
jgi:hypothetical protein